jgi:hypothetical protein
MKVVASGVGFAISAAVKANRQPEVPSGEQDDSIYPRGTGSTPSFTTARAISTPNRWVLSGEIGMKRETWRP